MSNVVKILVVVALMAVAVLVGTGRGVSAERDKEPGKERDRDRAAACPPSCQQWEVMLAPSTRTAADPKSLPEAGKPYVEQSPQGWEPFAFGPTGQLVYRRCAR